MGQAGQNLYPCANCGTPNSPTDQFCANCGYFLAGGPLIANSPDATVISSGPTTMTSSSGRRVTGSLTAGVLLSGRYRIISLVGKGGFGAVYKASDGRLSQRIVALKEMSDAHFSSAERVRAVEGFRQEANLLVPLKHPNLPDVSDFFEEGGKAYLAMEFIEGKTLEKVQEEAGGPLNEALVMGWALQLCDVLHYLHTQPQPIIFRDLKPSNIMLSIRDGQIKLIDFGIARLFKSTAAKDTTSLGSRGYAPLEQYGRAQSDPRSDIYALGATLYDLLTNSVPADAPTRRIHPQIFETPCVVNPNISPAAESIVLKAMGEEPKDRYQSALEMFQAIAASGFAPNMPSGTPSATLSHGSAPLLSTQIATSQAVATPPALAQTAVATQGSSNPPQTVGAPPQSPGSPSGAPPTFPPQQATPPKPGISRRTLLIGGAVAVAALVGGGWLLTHLPGSGSSVPTGPTVTLDMAYSTEKADWLNAAITAFNNSSQATLLNSNKTIQVKLLENSGSLNTGDSILSGGIMPVIWSPASTLELNRLNYKWMAAHNGQGIISSSTDFAPKSLVASPIVLAVWKDRADAFRSKQSIDWDTIHTALTGSSWAAFGHPEWRAITLGQTNPTQSNSGLLAIMLMAYAYAQKTNGPQSLSADYITNTSELWNYIQVFESAVSEFGLSSGTYFTETIIPQGVNHSMTITYENLVLLHQSDAQQRTGEPLEVFYPSQEAVSNHPLAILQAPWVTSEQKTAAKQFRDFLLSHDQQVQALKYGFRPSDFSISLTDTSISNNPFSQLSHLAPVSTFDLSKDVSVPFPRGDAIDALITQWKNHNPGV